MKNAFSLSIVSLAAVSLFGCAYQEIPAQGNPLILQTPRAQMPMMTMPPFPIMPMMSSSTQPSLRPTMMHMPSMLPTSTPTQIKMVASCTQLGTSWSMFESKMIPLSFCYPTTWGIPTEAETTIAATMRTGDMWLITFPKAPAGTDVYFYTHDLKLSVGSLPHENVCWSCISTTMSSADLQKALGSPKTTFKTISRYDRNNTFGLKTIEDYFDNITQKQIKQTYWMFPQAINNGRISLVIGGLTSNAAILESLVKSALF